MSELDLGATPTATPAAAAAPAPGALVLTPPAPVVVVKEEQAVTAVPVEDAKQAELRAKASAFVAELTAIDAKSPAFSQKVASITSMGDQDMRAAATVSSRMLDRPAAIAKGKSTGDAQTRVANTLVDLRNTVTDLDPNRADLTGAKKVLKWLPGGSKIDAYFARYQSAQQHLDAIIKSLASGQDELRKDNAAIETEKANLWASMGRLAEYNQLASALDEALVEKIAQLEAAGRQEDADAVRSDALFPVRQRRQDFMTQMAVSVQGYMALDLVRRNNLELIKGVDRAQTTTVAALRTAVIVAQALSRQKLVLDQITALNTVTSNLIESTSEQLRIQGAAINQQASEATLDVAKLQAAFDNVFQTMDALDTFRAQAVDSMAQTVTALEGQIQRAQPYLERTRQRELNG
ncbi:toxic anion resistance protein [Cellulomonas fimi]|uniref:Toxic anion resistance family protein n=1 Tax=Cellulomonas fimi (strain ATCC 484 / DSM 20113 / JCM 1341 / CCUG 24087 / LMG 16345 / NBRC 15513 / NCIMB 8980 / NCTC 7547 / NRS-133) TaxID=590998 RepID=F4H5N1_CELFA|nr:toxic anion resistance protein [Cellulomonas fimi]AEE44355.1 toxic anion resistance family protein [Cellulomonas fimi ATCC 484]NNH08120.1 toxic anion resistance protein [Cellulomonas fimi]VEH26190.1 Toxic anion resistance protein (TelA) [Cellulomonas fimi]